MDDAAENLKLAETHAAAVVLIGLQGLERGYADLMAHDPLVTDALGLARSEALARGVPEGDITTTPIHIQQTALRLGAEGVDPHVVATETKSEAAAEKEAEESNTQPEEQRKDEHTDTMHVASTAHEPPPLGAVVDPAERPSTAPPPPAPAEHGSPVPGSPPTV
jgi:hypothetical protein